MNNVTAKDLRDAIEVYWDAPYYEDEDDRLNREGRRDAELAAFDTLVQDAENWNTINPSGDAQVLIPKAAFDAMAEKAVNFDIFRAILNKTRSVHAEIDGDQFWFHMPNSISGTDFDFIDALNEACFQIFDGAEEIAEALKAVPE